MFESPINLIMDDMKTELVKKQEEQVLRAVQRFGIVIDKEELIRALKYDRDQYDKGYRDAMSEIIRCKDCIHRGEKPIADGRYWCDIHDTFMYYCSDAEGRTDK